MIGWLPMELPQFQLYVWVQVVPS